jgi:hypothetical protein
MGLRRRSARPREGFDVAFGLGRRLFIPPQAVYYAAGALLRRGLFISPRAINSPQALFRRGLFISPQAILSRAILLAAVY